MNLNIPDTRQDTLSQRLGAGQQIVAAEVAAEFAVSLDTIRRDILALEAEGKAQRVRGGAIPVARPASPLHERLAGDKPVNTALIGKAIAQIGPAQTILLDGGTTTLALIRKLPLLNDRLIITPSPWVAIACQERGIAVFLLGGTLSPQGGIATGNFAQEKVNDISADITVLGACGLEAGFGLSSDDHHESQMKKAMSAAANKTFVLTDSEKIGRKARHHTLSIHQIDLIMTDVSPELMADFASSVAII